MEKNTKKEFKSLCEFISHKTIEDFAGEVVEQAANILVDTLGVIIAGSRSREVSTFADNLLDWTAAGSPKKTVTCPGRKGTFDPLNGAMINGMAGSSLEFEEGNFSAAGHPGIQIVPAVVAMSESRCLTLGDLLCGLICGYEAGARIGGATSLRRGLHPNGSWGTVGAALGAGSECGLSGEQLFRLGNIASSFAISPYIKNSFAGRTVSVSFAGMSNYLALLSILMFESGIVSDEKCFEMTFSKFVSEGIKPEALTRDLGIRFLITSNYLKPYPTCRFTHPAIEALERILEAVSVMPEEVNSINVTSFRAATHMSGAMPENEEAMRFSIPYLLATRIVLGGVDLDIFRKDPLQRKEIRNLSEKVEMEFSEQYEEMLPDHTPARITLKLRGGREFSSEVVDSLGSHLKPLSRDEITAKFLSISEPVLGSKAPERFLDRILAFDMQTSMNSVMSLLHP